MLGKRKVPASVETDNWIGLLVHSQMVESCFDHSLGLNRTARRVRAAVAVAAAAASDVRPRFEGQCRKVPEHSDLK